MRIALVSQWFSDGMGYAENLLPKALAKQGHEVYLFTSTAQVYYNSPKYKDIYEPFIGPNIVALGESNVDGFTLCRLPLYKPNVLKGTGPGLIGLMEYLKKIKPDIIQVFEIGHVETYTAALYCKNSSCILFSESHTHASVVRKNNQRSLYELFWHTVNLFNFRIKLINKQSALCYAIAKDVKEMAISLYHFPEKKIKVQSLGVDCEIFKPDYSQIGIEERTNLRKQFNVEENDILCIYTGRFTKDKDPHCLASAIDTLHHRGQKNYKAIFLGKGSREDVNYLKSKRGCTVLPFVLMKELPKYYRASDIGVWPREESTSQIDAFACGLPIIISNKVSVLERIDGNGLLYEEGNSIDLAEKIASLNKAIRAEMSLVGIQKAQEKYSWDRLAKERILDYQKKLHQDE